MSRWTSCSRPSWAARRSSARWSCRLESGDKGAGTCDGGYSCTYSHTLSWRGPTTPLPMEHNPRVVFERMFGDGGSTDPAARAVRLESNRSLLDSVVDKIGEVRRGLGPSDAGKLTEYLEAVRDIERRIQRAEEQLDRELPAFDQPAGVPATFAEHARLMFDLQVLAYQSDLTRVITFMVGREFSSRTYPEIGAPGGHHPLSHEHSPESQRQLAAINIHHAEQVAYYLDRLRSTPDGDGTLLDHVLLYYGAGMCEGRPPALEPAAGAGGRRRRAVQGRPARQVSERAAAGQPAPGGAGEVRHAPGQDPRQHRPPRPVCLNRESWQMFPHTRGGARRTRMLAAALLVAAALLGRWQSAPPRPVTQRARRFP